VVYPNSHPEPEYQKNHSIFETKRLIRIEPKGYAIRLLSLTRVVKLC